LARIGLWRACGGLLPQTQAARTKQPATGMHPAQAAGELVPIGLEGSQDHLASVQPTVIQNHEANRDPALQKGRQAQQDLGVVDASVERVPCAPAEEIHEGGDRLLGPKAKGSQPPRRRGDGLLGQGVRIIARPRRQDPRAGRQPVGPAPWKPI